ncbi:alkaline phosphatase D family protein [Halopseudomonas bauzanensis]|uniref:Twin-arginine translocation signal domain-containing protein n=1 Tax=Halopseudomonas bauzanensis TaxID=653930 RepID=A0A4U0YLG1_9GAMM|nr:alkaline phosphatase D family protein [Halopseudomonas bauzanensis]TKA91389.1 twin-arginine translocation signal domain-containing protein [Halopseudomonas bauzanensis]
MSRFTRRDFLRLSLATVGTVAISTGLQGCLSSSSNSRADEQARQAAFLHGVASGDPLQDRIMIWTKVTLQDTDQRDIEISWEVASDAEFTDLLHDGSFTTGAERDFTLKVDVLNLLPGQSYYYRFHCAGATSPTGSMRTLPAARVDQVRLAVLSCSNFPAGYFHVYAEAARVDQLDAVVHLGDYIYEYGAGGYASEDAQALGRQLPADNAGELLTLTDYRRRYALYRTDPDLQRLHASVPWILVWDDHEVANDAWREGAENHNEGDGDFAERKLAALQAYFEWQPIRPASEHDEETLYRRFDFADLVSLHMLDTRIIGRDEQLDFTNYLTAGGMDGTRLAADLADPDRTMLGLQQLDWLQTQLATSTATWQVLGQQVLMGRMLVPAEMLAAILATMTDPGSTDITALLTELVTLKVRQQNNDPTLTPQELARITTLIPYNLDAWDGYAYEREVLLETCANLNKNLVVLAGDTHNAWASDLKTVDGKQVGVEFATASVSSPGLEAYLDLPPEMIQPAEQAITMLVDDLHYLNVNQRGFMVVTLTQEQARADWHFVDTIKQTDYRMDTSRSHSLQTLPGAGQRHLQALR